MKRVFTHLIVVILTMFSCSEDSLVDATELESFEFSTPYLYKGVFTNNDGTTRGKVIVNVNVDGTTTASLTLHTGNVIELTSQKALGKETNKIELHSATGSNVELSWEFSVASDGSSPIIKNAKFNGRAANVMIAQETRLVPVTPITGTYDCINCSTTYPSFPSNGGTWNMMSVGSGANQGFMTQVAYGGNVYSSTNSIQENCDDNGTLTNCEIRGNISVLGYAVSWSGNHTYLNSQDIVCSDVSGIWSAPSLGSSSGAQGTFISDLDCGDFYVYDFEGNFYNSVFIGEQFWMKSNLNVSHYRNGDIIPQVQDPAQWASLTTGAWCYYENITDNGTEYGKLYNWYAVNDPRGLAPAGWHIPSNDEWLEAADYLGGASIAGGKMKSVTGWDSPNTGATNESDFTGLPGGYLFVDGSTTQFIEQGAYGRWWQSTSSSATTANYSYLSFNQVILTTESNALKTFGLSVRCVKDL